MMIHSDRERLGSAGAALLLVEASESTRSKILQLLGLDCRANMQERRKAVTGVLIER
jgi:hypothetical protein